MIRFLSGEGNRSQRKPSKGDLAIAIRRMTDGQNRRNRVGMTTPTTVAPVVSRSAPRRLSEKSRLLLVQAQTTTIVLHRNPRGHYRAAASVATMTIALISDPNATLNRAAQIQTMTIVGRLRSPLRELPPRGSPSPTAHRPPKPALRWRSHWLLTATHGMILLQELVARRRFPPRRPLPLSLRKGAVVVGRRGRPGRGPSTAAGSRRTRHQTPTAGTPPPGESPRGSRTRRSGSRRPSRGASHSHRVITRRATSCGAQTTSSRTSLQRAGRRRTVRCSATAAGDREEEDVS
jgi:hypothetical protein